MSERAAIVLAGGRSKRFGEQDKALASLCGSPMLTHVVNRLAAVADEILISCRQSQQTPFDRVLSDAASAPRFVTDPVPDQGPLAGLTAAVEATDAAYVAVLACDMPGVDPAFVQFLFSRAAGTDGVIPRVDGRLQPTQAVYRRTAITTAARETLTAGERSLHAAIDQLQTEIVSEETVREQTDVRSLSNINTQEELRSFEAGYC